MTRAIGGDDMSLELTSASVWNEIERHNFAVLGMVTAGHQARTVGIVDVVDDLDQ